MRTRRIFLSLALLLGVMLCGLGVYVLLDALGPGALRSDVAEVIQIPDRARPQLTCLTPSRTRMGYCLTALDQPTITQIVGRLGLSQILPADGAPLDLPTVEPGGCQSSAVFGDGTGLRAYWVAGRPDQLALRNGGQFEYLLLLTRPETGQACIQVSYAYG
jgi:hypothetical protein